MPKPSNADRGTALLHAPRIPLVIWRMKAHRLVLAAVLLIALTGSALAAALAVVAGQTVPQAAQRKLAAAPGTSVLVSGPLTAGQAATVTAALRSAMRSALRTVPFEFYRALWSQPLSLPAAAGAPRAPMVQASAAAAIQVNAILLAGHWPPAPRPGQPIPAAIPAATASLLHLSAGQVLTLRAGGAARPVRVRLTGIFRPRDRASAYWRLDLLGTAGFRSSGRRTIYGPLVVSPAAFGGALTVASGSWVIEPDLSRITDSQLGALARRIRYEQQLMPETVTLGYLSMRTRLPAVLGDMASNLVVAHSLLAIGGLQLLLLVAVAVGLAARLLASQRQPETALLSARGGDRWQLARLNLAEAILLAAVTTGAGGLAGWRLAGLLAGTGPPHAAGVSAAGTSAGGWWAPAGGWWAPAGGWWAPAGAWWAPAGAWWAAAGATVLCAAMMAASGLRGVSPGTARVRRGRQPAVAGLVQVGADAALVLLAAAAVWQLRRYSTVAPAGNGTLGVDPVLVAAPVLALAAGTIVLLRLLPAAATAGDRLARRGRRLAAAMASWQISRRPVRQAGPALLVVLAVATGTLALSQHQSWVRSARDQAAFDAGADARVDTPLPVSAAQAGLIAAVPGARHAMPVARLGYGTTGQAIAVDAGQAAATVLLRPDLSPLPATVLFRLITPGGVAPGLAIPGRPVRVEVAASLGPASLRLGPARASLSVQDADGNVYALPAGVLNADGRVHTLVAEITPSGEAVYPLRLLAVTLDYTLPRAAARPPAVLTVHSVAAQPAASGQRGGRFAAGAALRGWTPAAFSRDLAGLLQIPGATAGRSGPPIAGTWLATASGGQAFSFNPGYGQATAATGPALPIQGQVTLSAGRPATTAIPGIATQAYLRAAGAAVGSTVQVSADGAQVPVRIVAAVTAFPTISGPGGGVIVDLAALQEALTARSLAPAPVSEWWLATAAAHLLARPAGGPPASRTARLPSGSAVTTPGRLAAGLLGDPLSAAPQQALLAISAAAAALAIAGCSVSIAMSVRERRPQSALLSALGVSRVAQAGQLCLEELMLSLPSATAGLALGAALSWLLVPAVTLTTAATAPVPAALTEFAWSRAVPLAIAIAIVPALVAAATVAARPDPAARLRATEAA
jgi:hypothetical protein